MAAKAQDVRDEWEIMLISALEELDIAVISAPKNKRVLELKIQNVESVFKSLQKAHTQYCQKAKIALGSTESTDFVKSQVKLKVKAVTAARDTMTEGDDNIELSALENKLDGERFQLQVEIEGKIASLKSMASTALLTTEQYESVMDIIDDCDSKLKRYMECGDLLMAGKDSQAAAKIKEDSQTFFKTNSVGLSTLKCTYLAKAPIKVESQQTVSADPTVVSSAVKLEGKQPVKIKAMDCPTWDGRYRTFPRFKKMWEENITPRHEDSALHYLL